MNTVVSLLPRVATLTDFLDVKAYAQYMPFQVAKQNSIDTLSQQISNAEKGACQHLKKSAESARQRELVQATEWLDRLEKRLEILIPRSAHDMLLLPN